MNINIWNFYETLTREEYRYLTTISVDFLNGLECKNSWDFFVNEISIKEFVITAFLHSMEKVFGSRCYLKREYEQPTKYKDCVVIVQIMKETSFEKYDSKLKENHSIWITELGKAFYKELEKELF